MSGAQSATMSRMLQSYTRVICASVKGAPRSRNEATKLVITGGACVTATAASTIRTEVDPRLPRAGGSSIQSLCRATID